MRYAVGWELLNQKMPKMKLIRSEGGEHNPYINSFVL